MPVVDLPDGRRQQHSLGKPQPQCHLWLRYAELVTSAPGNAEESDRRRKVSLLVEHVERSPGQTDRVEAEACGALEVAGGRRAAEPTVDNGAKPGDFCGKRVADRFAVGALQSPCGRLVVAGVDLDPCGVDQERGCPLVVARLRPQEVLRDLGNVTLVRSQDAGGVGVDAGAARRQDLRIHAVALESMRELDRPSPLQHPDVGERVRHTSGLRSVEFGNRGDDREICYSENRRCLEHFVGATDGSGGHRHHAARNDRRSEFGDVAVGQLCRWRAEFVE